VDEMTIRVPRGDRNLDKLFSTARWDERPLPDFRDGRHIYLGRDEAGRDVGYMDDRHMFLCAGTRAGKGTTCILPALLSYAGSCLVIDPKGENARITAAWRERQGQAVHVLDPYGLVADAWPSATYNPLSILEPDDPLLADKARLIADALVIPSSERERHWDDAARDFLTGVLVHVVTGPHAPRDLVRVQAAVQLAEEGLEAEMRESAWPLVRAAASAYYEKEERERKSVLSTVRNQLAFLGSPPMQAVLRDGPLSLDALKARPTTIYLCMPPLWFEANKRWFRLFVNLALLALGGALAAREDLPVLMILDEFPTLGTMPTVESAVGLMAGYGVKIWTIVQDINQLRSLYRDRWQSFIGNSGLVQFFGNVDRDTCEYVSKLCGEVSHQTETVTETWSQSRKGEAGGSRQTAMTTVPLLRPDEVSFWFSARKGVQIVKIPERQPAKLQRIPFHEHPLFRRRSA
jgi:type IV secretion system protein VirD4